MGAATSEVDWRALAALLDGLKLVPPAVVSRRLANPKWVVEGTVDVEGRSVRVRVAVPASFPAARPEIFLIEQIGSPVLLPHVEPDGFVCYAREGRLVLDPLDAEGALLGCTELALNVVRESLEGPRREAVAQEFVAFWRQTPECVEVRGFVTPSGQPRRLVARKSTKNSDKPFMIADNVAAFTSYYAVQPWCGDIHGRAIYVPLRPGSLPEPPGWGKKWAPVDYRRLVRDWCSEETISWLSDQITRWKRQELVVFGLPLRGGSTALFGVWFQHAFGGHPLSAEGNAKRCVPLHLVRKDRSFLLPRGGGIEGLEDKEVCLVGCGSVGGLIAAELVRAGVRNLTLVDPDIMQDENTYRHALGRVGLGHGKAASVAADLEVRYPYTKIRQEPGRAEALIAGGKVAPGRFDLFVIAVDDMTAALHLGQALQSKPPRQGAVNAWVDPMGLGGHVLTTIPGSSGCLRCLFTKPTTGRGLFTHNRASFVAEGEKVEADLGGCGNRFTPFGTLDASQTAVIAARAAVDVLLGRATEATLRSWKGDAREFQAAGYATSDRYSMSQAELDLAAPRFVNARCPQCSS